MRESLCTVFFSRFLKSFTILKSTSISTSGHILVFSTVCHLLNFSVGLHRIRFSFPLVSANPGLLKNLLTSFTQLLSKD